LYSRLLGSVLLAASGAPALAQEPPQEPAGGASQQGVISYTPADFAAARPNTALDMIQRLPGFTFDGGDNVRGFAGAAGNVLIDSQRPTIKTDTLSDTLARITIDQVERIDLIRGAAPGIDMQGRTVVANVIRKRVDTFQQVLSLQGFVFMQTGDTIPGWNYQATRRSGDHQFDFQLGRSVSYDDSIGLGWRYSLNVPSNLLTTERANTEGDGAVHSARANYKGPQLGGTLSLNGLISTDEFKNEQSFFNTATEERFVNRSANDRGEIGVNYLRDLTSNLELELIGLSKIAFGRGVSTGDTGASTQLFEVEAEAGESIGRSVLRYTHSPELSFEGGGEVAFNYREQEVGLTVNGAPQTLPVPFVRVEELRGEAFAQGTWRPSPQWTLEAGVRFERSTITQSGTNPLERSFDYPKPRALATWSPLEDTQVRMRVERRVGQLNFQDFSSNVNLNSGVVTTGSTDLRPDQRWIYEAAFEQRFWENGAAILTLRHEDIEDVIDQRPFPDAVNIVGFGPGNIGDGTNDVVDLSLTLPLKPIGLEGGEIKATGVWQNSEVTDPLTGEKRRISGQRPENISFNFRQDLPAQKLTFGLGWFGGWEEDYYRRNEVNSLRLEHFLASFVEWKPDTSFTLRAELNNYDPYRFYINRFVYDGQSRAVGNLVEVEQELRKSQVIGRLSLRWTFD
jgi:hypothetical protein